MICHRFAHVALMVVCFLFADSAGAASFPTARAREVAAKAEGLIARGEYAGAATLLEREHAQCARYANPTGCATILLFTHGYLHQEWAKVDSARRNAHFLQAAEKYKAALAASPRNPQVMNNLALVYRQLGRYAESRELFTAAAGIAPRGTASREQLRGDMLLRNRQPAAAVSAYRAALETVPDNAAALQGLLNAYRRLPGIQNREIYRFARDLKNRRQTLLAVQALELTIQRAFRSEPDLADEALENWVELRASLGTLSLKSLENLPPAAQWRSPGLAELAACLANPVQGAREIRWWQRHLARRHIITQALRASGNARKDRGDKAAAIEALKSAMDVAPSFHLYNRPLLQGRSIEALDIALELAALYNGTGNTAAFEELVRRLFNEKALSYARRDLRAIQRYHTVLGLIYSDREQWTSGWADNAIFQLSHALKTARTRAGMDPRHFQPLPDLAARLARAYRETQDPRAGDAYLQAAMGYLDLDDLKNTGAILSRARSARVPEGKLSSLGSILASRARIQKGITVTRDPTGIPIPDATEKWLFTSRLPGLEDEFVARQRFKALADLGSRATSTGRHDDARFFSAHALSVARRQATLVSTGDVKRIEGIGTAILRDFRGVQVPDRSGLLIRGENLEQDRAPGGKHWTITAPGYESTQGILLKPEVFIVGKIIETPEIREAVKQHDIAVRLKGNQVTLEQGAAPDTAVRKTIEGLNKITDVTGVRVKEVKRP